MCSAPSGNCGSLISIGVSVEIFTVVKIEHITCNFEFSFFVRSIGGNIYSINILPAERAGIQPVRTRVFPFPSVICCAVISAGCGIIFKVITVPCRFAFRIAHIQPYFKPAKNRIPELARNIIPESLLVRPFASVVKIFGIRCRVSIRIDRRIKFIKPFLPFRFCQFRRYLKGRLSFSRGSDPVVEIFKRIALCHVDCIITIGTKFNAALCVQA